MKPWWVTDFRKLRVWRAAQDFAVAVHLAAKDMNSLGSAKLADQLTRAAASVPANIVEGCSHDSLREFGRFLRYARASVTEAESHLELARELRMISDSTSNV